MKTSSQFCTAIGKRQL